MPKNMISDPIPTDLKPQARFFRVEVDREAIVKDIYFVRAPNIDAATAAVRYRPDDWEPHEESVIVEFITEEEDVSDAGSVEVDTIPEGAGYYDVMDQIDG
jgi:hypothetical protein